MPSLRPIRPALLLACALALFASTNALAVTPNGRLQIIHMDVGQGDGTVIITPLGQVVMIDDGLYNNTAAPVAQLAALGVTHVDLHFASHYHADHIGAIGSIVASGVTIDAGWDRAQSYSSQSYTNYVNALVGKRHTLVKNQIFTLDAASAHPVTIKCIDLAGAGISTTDENAKCVVLKVSYGEFDEVFGGDLTGDASNGGNIEAVVGPEVGPVEVYKVHHHGSRYSSNDTWLNAITPKIGVIQCGNGNSYGHPTAEALSRLHAHNVKTYWNETGAGVAPNATWDKVASGQVIIQATWEGAGVDTVRGPGFADTFTNSGVAGDLIAPNVALFSPNGGEVWDTGTLHSIDWSASDNTAVDSVNVDFSVHGLSGPWAAIQHEITGAGPTSWTLPATATDSAAVRVTAFDHALNQGTVESSAMFEIHAASTTGVPGGMDAGLAFAAPQPNPSASDVTFRFTLPAAGDTRLDVIDLAGRRVWGWQEFGSGAGPHAVQWDGRAMNGDRSTPGLYWVRLSGAFGARVVKMVRLQ